MDAVEALADLTEISSQILQAAILDRDGAAIASTFAASSAAERFASGVAALMEEADRQAAARHLGAPVRLEVSTREGCVFAVRSRDLLIAATTVPDPTVGLIFYDLKKCLASLDEAPRTEGSNGAAAGSGTARVERRLRNAASAERAEPADVGGDDAA